MIIERLLKSIVMAVERFVVINAHEIVLFWFKSCIPWLPDGLKFKVGHLAVNLSGIAIWSNESCRRLSTGGYRGCIVQGSGSRVLLHHAREMPLLELAVHCSRARLWHLFFPHGRSKYLNTADHLFSESSRNICMANQKEYGNKLVFCDCLATACINKSRARMFRSSSIFSGRGWIWRLGSLLIRWQTLRFFVPAWRSQELRMRRVNVSDLKTLFINSLLHKYS